MVIISTARRRRVRRWSHRALLGRWGCRSTVRMFPRPASQASLHSSLMFAMPPPMTKMSGSRTFTTRTVPGLPDRRTDARQASPVDRLASSGPRSQPVQGIRGGQIDAGVLMVVARKGPARDPALEASVPAAIAGRPGDFGNVRPGERIVAPFASTIVRAVMSSTCNGHASPGA